MKKQLLFIFATLVFVPGCGLFQGTQKRSNDDFAIATVKKLRNAQTEFVKHHNRYAQLTELCELNLLSKSLADGVEDGYMFSVNVKEKSYTAQAIPKNYGTEESEGNFSLYVDESGVIRSATKKGIDLPKWEIAGPESIPIKEQ